MTRGFLLGRLKLELRFSSSSSFRTDFLLDPELSVVVGNVIAGDIWLRFDESSAAWR